MHINDERRLINLYLLMKKDEQNEDDDNQS